ncbi:MAG: hypothetical protein AB8B78_11970 [Polaribacter sp.]
MKLYKNTITIFALCFLGTIYAQKFDKKFTENFKVNKDVEVSINASNTDINVTTWNKDEVQVQAFLEIEGLSKEEAEKYFKNWDFEALGNKRKVEITSKGDYSFGANKDFLIFNDMNFSFPEIEMPNFDMIVIPDMDFDFDTDFDFDFDFEDLDDLDKNMGKNGKYEFNWNDGSDKVVIKTEKQWKAFKKTKKYKELKKKMAETKEKMKKKFAKSKIEMKKELANIKLEFKKIDREKIRKELVKAKEHIMKMKLNFRSSSNSDDMTINGKKIKIKKRLEIKVPKKATFDLNTRHCKLKLPNTVASGNVKYGTFDANNLIGGKLTIDYSPVKIKDLNACTLFLNNVTDAKIASVTNSTMSNNSSGVQIFKINENVNLTDKFGELTINSFNTDFGTFVLNLSHSDATVILGDVGCKFKYNVNKVKLENKQVSNKNKSASKNNLIKLNGDYSQITIK